MLDFFLLFQIKFFEIVVQFNYSHGLYKKGGAGGGLIVDHAGYLASVFRFDGNAVAAVSLGDDGVLKIGAGRAVHQSV